MRWILFDFKTAKEPWFDACSELYLKKLKPFVQFEIQHLKSNRSDRDEATVKLKFEEKILLEKITSDDFVILLDERGRSLDSIEFSQLAQRANTSGKKRGVFIIGGAYGVTDTIRQRSSAMVCLSGLTMNHLIAEAVLLEQFYRAQTILNRIPYHNGSL